MCFIGQVLLDMDNFRNTFGKPKKGIPCCPDSWDIDDEEQPK